MVSINDQERQNVSSHHFCPNCKFKAWHGGTCLQSQLLRWLTQEDGLSLEVQVLSGFHNKTHLLRHKLYVHWLYVLHFIQSFTNWWKLRFICFLATILCITFWVNPCFHFSWVRLSSWAVVSYDKSKFNLLKN